jgi:hypothetical protein
MPKGEEHEPRKTYRPGEGYRPRDPFFQRMADMEAQESAEAFVRAVYSSPTMPQPPTASAADLDMMDRFPCVRDVLAYPLTDAAFLSLIRVKGNL